MNIWAMNDCDWVAAETQLQAALCYADHCGEKLESVINDDLIDAADGAPYQLGDEDLNHLKFHDDDDEGFGKPDYKPRTFREQLDRLIAERAKFPRFFASTEY